MHKLITLAILGFLSPLALQASSGVKGNQADYIIVGVGTAGGLLAKKLTDDKKTSVIALHSGQNFTDSFVLKYGKNTIFSVAASLLGTTLPPEIQEIFQEFIDLSAISAAPLYETGSTVPQVCVGDDELLWVIPSPEGGGSAVNAGAWCRGTNQLYAQWETIAGPEWSVGQIMNTYKKLEDYTGKTSNKSARGKDGPLKVIQNEASQLSLVFTQAVINGAGVPFVIDYNDPNTPIGSSSQFQLTRRGKQGYYRVSSVTAFLNDHIVNGNGKGVDGRKLQIHLGSAALRVIWNGNTAVGVEYTQNGTTKQVYASKGVIVCAGLRSSPFLLSSGVGPADLLTPLGIPVVYDNPNVGQGLADQPHSIVVFSSNPKDSGAGGNTPFASIAWLEDPHGLLPGRQLRFSTADIIPGITAGLFDLCQPLSRGTVSINSANPLDPPVIDFGLLCDPSDLDLYVAGFQTYIKNINIALQAIDPSYQLLLPDPSILDDTDLLIEFIKASVESNMHFQSHCRMAQLAQGGVVDSNGRVYGVNNLLVADNSIVPQCMDGSPMASAYMIAANIARLLGYP
jgi:choline dehydrogenase-like flavoprotein